MRRLLLLAVLVVGFALLAGWAGRTNSYSSSFSEDFVTGAPAMASMSALTFGPDGILLIGDSKGGAVYAVDLDDRTPREETEAIRLPDLEGQIASLLGTNPDAVLVHDMAVNPISQNIYLAASRTSARANWNSPFSLPNDLGAAEILLKVTPAGVIDEVSLKGVKYAKADLPNPVDETKKHRWKDGVSLRVDTITDLVYKSGKVYVAGLSNEEFASTLWQIPFPFKGNVSATTVEIFHGAHGKYETHSPIRTFLPYNLNNEEHLLAAYLCTPLVTLPVASLEDGKHLMGKTVAEFGSGNYPLDMVRYKKNDKDYILISNSNLPFMVVDPGDVAAYEGAITEEVPGYLAGVPYSVRSGTGIEQMDLLNPQYLVALQRMPSGKLNMVSYPVEKF